MDASRLLAEEDAGWHDLRAMLDGIGEDQLEQPGVTPDGWSVKDTMFHVAAWMADCAAKLERMRLGTFEDPAGTAEDVDRQNREWFELSRTLHTATVRTGLIAARARMLQEWASLPTVTAAAWESFEESGPLHYHKHAADVRAWVRGA